MLTPDAILGIAQAVRAANRPKDQAHLLELAALSKVIHESEPHKE